MWKRGIVWVLLLLSLLLTACDTANNADCSNLPAGAKIKVEGAWSWAAATGSSAAYMVISNCGSEPDQLIKVSSSISGTTSMHQSEMVNGVIVMNEVSEIAIPAGKKVELTTGGYHIMMMDIQKEIKAGDPVDLTLQFAKNGEVKVSTIARNP